MVQRRESIIRLARRASSSSSVLKVVITVGSRGCIAIVQKLEQFLAGPGRGAFGAQVIQDQQRGRFYLFEDAIQRGVCWLD